VDARKFAQCTKRTYGAATHAAALAEQVGARDGTVRTRPNGPRMQAEGKKAKSSQWARAKFDGRLARALQSLANCC